VIGVGGGGCNAVRNMYHEGINGVTLAVCNTDSKSLAPSPVPVKIMLGEGLGAGGTPEIGRSEAEKNIKDIERLLSDGTKMVFVTASMGGGTGTGAAPVVAGVARKMGLLTIGVVTIPFYFEKKQKIIKALKGVDELRKNVDALLIINNERLCDVYADSNITVRESFARADNILKDAVKGIAELITVNSDGGIDLDFRDVETTMRNGGGAIMAMGRASGENRVERAILNALDSPLLYGNDIGKAKRILFNIYSSDDMPIIVKEMQEIDEFFDQLDPNIEVIWGISTDNQLGEDAKVTILATGMEDEMQRDAPVVHEDDYYERMIPLLYKPMKKKVEEEPHEPEMEVVVPQEPEPAVVAAEPDTAHSDASEPLSAPQRKHTVLAKMRQWLENMMADTEE
jgi:cell division protein FtsZ